MTEQFKPHMMVSKIQYYVAMAILVISLLSTVISIGYTIRRIDELYEKVILLEQKGSITAQLTSRDVQWIIDSMKEQTAKLTRVESKIDRHMAGK